MPDLDPNSSKRLPAACIALVLLVTLMPVFENWKPNPHDDFPLSYYPMFSARRSSTFSGQSIVGLDASGKRIILPHTFVGPGGLNQVRHQVRARVKDKQATELCSTVAARVAKSRRRAFRDIHSVQVLTVTHNVDVFFDKGDSQLKEKVHATCPVTPTQEVQQ